MACDKSMTCPATGRRDRCGRTKGHVGRCDCCGHYTRRAKSRRGAFGRALSNRASGNPQCDAAPRKPGCLMCACRELRGHRGRHNCPHCGRTWR